MLKKILSSVGVQTDPAERERKRRTREFYRNWEYYRSQATGISDRNEIDAIFQRASSQF